MTSLTPSLEGVTANLMVDDVARTVSYYRDVLGFEPLVTVPETVPLQWALLKRDDVALMFQESHSLIAQYPVLKDRVPGGGLSLFITVRDVEGLFASVLGKAEILEEPHDTFYGMREFAMLDCNGLVLTFAERIA
ncbi:VOC family protein [Pararhodospirillum oryzae]|uniref:Bleomycin resistance family protein n=1 Tax=Pararhodospirillum oryzae TaxID=478448 RepID=A0A512H3S2_9PROT|nr:VOC family protein [Pararhodospirillum oryzae]GEO80114.1 bleomycin resistance family protein [Pararhodospirillum oryzae]